MFRVTVVLLMALALLGVSQAETRAVIRFADLGGIKDWRPDGSEAIFIEGRNDRWFRATFFGRCHGLRFTDTIAFITEVGGHLDKFSSIWVDGQRCHFKSFYRVSGPDSRDLYQVDNPEANAPNEVEQKP